ncbi:MAG TPA: M55 family metallopeptidase [Bacteroidales bacterium]|jgi:D-amino peptidase|nr:M55 family metallopeptidase [Bacteroidales bacterium]
MKTIQKLFFIILLTTTTMVQAQNKKLKIYISADMEGVVGAVTGEQLGPGGFEYERFRKFMTAEVNACIKAAREAGADEILVSDSHGNGQNILIEKLPDDVMIVRSWPRMLGMMEGIDDSFDGAIFLGYHASTNSKEGVRAHTMSSANITSVKINNIVMPEAGINALIAGHFNVPIILITGDDIAVKETQNLLGDTEGAVVKWANSFHSAKTLTPNAAYEVIGNKTKAAIKRIKEFKPYKLKGPLTLDLSLKNYRPVELLQHYPGAKRIDSHTIRFVGKDIIEISTFLRFVTGYNIALKP